MSAQDRARFATVTGVSRETLSRLDQYVLLLEKWSRAINLVARTTLPVVWSRHVLDSAQLLRIAPIEAQRWADLGSGAGLPGLVVAAVAVEQRPQLKMTLVESDERKCVFMAEAARVMGVDVDIRCERIEAHSPDPFPIVSARALAPLPRLFTLLAPWLAQDGVALLLKGPEAARELTEASRHWHSACATIQSLTDPSGAILAVSELRRAAQ